MYVSGEFNPTNCLLGADERARAESDAAVQAEAEKAAAPETEIGD